MSIYGRLALTEWIALAMADRRVLIGYARESDGTYRGTIQAIGAYRKPIVVCVERRKHIAHALGDAHELAESQGWDWQ